MTRHLSIFWVIMIQLLVFLQGLHARVKKNSDKNALAYYIQEEQQFGADTTALKNFLKPLYQKELKVNKEQQTAVYYALMGRGTSRKIGQVNEISNRYFQRAVDIALDKKDDALMLWLQVELAKYRYQFSQLEGSLPYFMEASFRIGAIPSTEQIVPEESYRSLGFFFYTLGEYGDAIHYLKEAAYLAADSSVMKASVLDNLARCYLLEKDTSRALAYLKDAKSLAVAIGAKARLARVNGMLAQISLGRGKLDSARYYAEQDIRLSTESGDFKNKNFAEIIKANVLLANGEVDSASFLLDRLSAEITKDVYQTDFLVEVERLKLKLAVEQGDNHQELLIRRSLSRLLDSARFGEDAQAIQRAKVLVAKERYLNEMDMNRLRAKQVRFTRRMYLTLLLMAVGVVVIAYIDFRRKMLARHHRYEKKVLSYRLEKTLLDQKLEQANRTLEDHLRYMTEKNRQIEGLQREIARISKSNLAEIEEKNGKLKQLLQSHVLTEEGWQNFKRTFDDVHPDYCRQIKIRYPELSENNIRFILLQKLGLSAQETANVLGISMDAINKNKQRLRLKLGESYDRVMAAI